jgi:hypothetical protein
VRIFRPTLVGAAVATVALVAGCGGGAQPGAAVPADTTGASPSATVSEDPLDTIVTASETTMAAGTARFTMDMNLSHQGETMTMAGEGVIDLTTNVADISMDLTLPGQQPVTTQMIMTEDGVYQQLPGSERWTSLGSAGLGGAGASPAKQLEMLRKGAKDVREVESAELRGAPARHFELTLDPAATAAASGAEMPPMQVGLIPADLYIDSEGRIAKLEMEMAQEGKPGMQMTMEYFDFGTPVDVQAPDPALVDPAPGTGGN